MCSGCVRWLDLSALKSPTRAKCGPLIRCTPANSFQSYGCPPFTFSTLCKSSSAAKANRDAGRKGILTRLCPTWPAELYRPLSYFFSSSSSLLLCTSKQTVREQQNQANTAGIAECTLASFSTRGFLIGSLRTQINRADARRSTSPTLPPFALTALSRWHLL
ncbi:hypothetical protein F4777DRAFT_489199 [Nemania sp. FL0916]|nr:hypothetical protein F4777DRAFT_489199 [Nemania sp. FL0916]